MILKIYTNDGEIEYLECSRFSEIPDNKIGEDCKIDALQIGSEDEKDSKSHHLFIAVDDTLYELHYLMCYVINDKGQTIDKI